MTTSVTRSHHQQDLLDEWKILRRVDGDLASQAAMVDIASSTEKKAMFPVFSEAVRRLLLLPIGTATVERSFSTLNRILCSERCRLQPDHVRQLMLLSVEGVKMTDVRDGRPGDLNDLKLLVNSAYKYWLKKPRRH